MIDRIIVALLWFNAISFGLYETWYFGWNTTAGSDSELIADGITGLLGSLALFGSLVGRNK